MYVSKELITIQLVYTNVEKSKYSIIFIQE